MEHSVGIQSRLTSGGTHKTGEMGQSLVSTEFRPKHLVWLVSRQVAIQWNSLPIDIRNTDCLSTFRIKLKTNFFTASYT